MEPKELPDATIVIRVVSPIRGKNVFRTGRREFSTLKAEDFIGRELVITRNGEEINRAKDIDWAGSGTKTTGCAFFFGLKQKNGLWFSSAARTLTPYNFLPGSDELRIRIKQGSPDD